MSDSPSPHPRRPLVRPGFDPAAQPWRVADEGLRAIPGELLTAHTLRSGWQAQVPWALDEVVASEARYPGREGNPVLAAVLIPMVLRADGVRVLLTQRAAHLHDHAGQISFPGGRIEDDDASPVAAALREAQEETGLGQEYVDVLGTMPAYVTSTGFSVTPVASLVRPGFTLVADAFEVAEIFEVPLAFLMDPANHRLYRATTPDGRTRQYYAMPWEGYFIWGATAGMLRNLYHALRAALR
ncbi:hydrolase [Bordetella ansorpii]|uniref:Hydrolase n=1 Tax=Bordetella ansorpii TaxID=288768 RepID=A0A157SCH9_9BORD|nr:CoA pyrophosphatase [Bordetella ansorpii]SAI68079.1 hydrolase [Bordetella ansorpii]